MSQQNKKRHEKKAIYIKIIYISVCESLWWTQTALPMSKMPTSRIPDLEVFGRAEELSFWGPREPIPGFCDALRRNKVTKKLSQSQKQSGLPLLQSREGAAQPLMERVEG